MEVHIACQNNNFFKAIWGVTITEGHIDLKWKSLRGKFQPPPWLYLFQVGANFDEGKIEAYKKEIDGRVGLAEVFQNFIDAVKANVETW